MILKLVKLSVLIIEVAAIEMQGSLLRQYFQRIDPLSYSIQRQPLQVLYKKGVLKIFAKFTGKHL